MLVIVGLRQGVAQICDALELAEVWGVDDGADDLDGVGAFGSAAVGPGDMAEVMRDADGG